mmetsp:Transcript_16839/g.23578  ORF Transcript_16839/g.23578 Transcript_16839/m.23578 type:complete len:89 (-) Transcript_16839:166-432(-)
MLSATTRAFVKRCVVSTRLERAFSTRTSSLHTRIEASSHKQRLRKTTETDHGNDYKIFLEKNKAALKKQMQMPKRGEHAKKFLKIPNL